MRTPTVQPSQPRRRHRRLPEPHRDHLGVRRGVRRRPRRHAPGQPKEGAVGLMQGAHARGTELDVRLRELATLGGGGGVDDEDAVVHIFLMQQVVLPQRKEVRQEGLRNTGGDTREIEQ